MMGVERGGSRGRLSAFLRREARAGAEKSLGGNERETCALRLARAIRCANRAGANARWRARARKQDTRAKRVRRLRVPKPAAARTEWSGTERGGGNDMQKRTAELRRRHGEHDKT